jgi:adenylate cyclase
MRGSLRACGSAGIGSITSGTSPPWSTGGGVVGSFDERPEPRMGIHWGTALYRDGDYYGEEINLASRVVARARGGEVLASDSVVDAVRGSTYLVFEETGQVKLKGFDEPRQLCRVSLRE